MGYHRAGFEVVGVDINPQPHYPFEFHQADALTYPLEGFALIHASPPCQGYANLGNDSHPRLIAPIRERLLELPYVIENIQDAKPHLRAPIRLCGSMFGLKVQRHRLFETNWPIDGLLPPCAHGVNGRIHAYYGKPGWLVWRSGGAQAQKKGRMPLLRGSVDEAPEDMGIDWMEWDGLREAIPPAYTEWIGGCALRRL